MEKLLAKEERVKAFRERKIRTKNPNEASGKEKNASYSSVISNIFHY